MSTDNFIWTDKLIEEFFKEVFYASKHNLLPLTTLKFAISDFKASKQQSKDRCNICGGELVYIRGKYPNSDKRQVCPTCNTERLEQINEISSKYYGVTCSNVQSNIPPYES